MYEKIGFNREWDNEKQAVKFIISYDGMAMEYFVEGVVEDEMEELEEAGMFVGKLAESVASRLGKEKFLDVTVGESLAFWGEEEKEEHYQEALEGDRKLYRLFGEDYVDVIKEFSDILEVVFRLGVDEILEYTKENGIKT